MYMYKYYRYMDMLSTSGVAALHHITLIHVISLFLLKSMCHFLKKLFALEKYVGICAS